MPDAPDSYQYMLSSERAVLSDMAELAARLGSPNTFVRTGVTIVQEDFTNGLGDWFAGSELYDTRTILDLENGGFGGASANMHADSGSSASALLYRYFNVPELQKTGIELSVEFPPYFDSFEFYLYLYYPEGQAIGWIKYDLTTKQFYYLDASASFVSFAAIDIEQASNHRYDQLKLIVDFETLEYHNFRYNQHYWSLANIPLRTVSGSGGNSLLAYIKATRDATHTADFYVSYILLTTGEI